MEAIMYIFILAATVVATYGVICAIGVRLRARQRRRPADRPEPASVKLRRRLAEPSYGTGTSRRRHDQTDSAGGYGTWKSDSDYGGSSDSGGGSDYGGGGM